MTNEYKDFARAGEEHPHPLSDIYDAFHTVRSWP